MKTNIKRIVSFLLTLCLIMGFMIPAVYADEAIVAKKTVEYSFQYLGPLGYTDTVYYHETKNEPTQFNYLPDMVQAYNDSKIASMIVTGSFYSPSAGMALTSTSITKGGLYPGAWLGFKIKSPGDGAFDVAVVPALSSQGTQLTTTPKGLAVYVLEADGNTDIEAAMEETQVGSDVSLYGKLVAQTAGSYEFTAGKDYYVVLKMTKDKSGGEIEGKGAATAFTLAGLQMTKACADAEDTAAQISSAPLGSTITLQADCDAAGKTITVNSGVTLDLNGKTLTATVNADGIVTDSGNGAGAIIGTSAVKNVGTNELALYDGSTCRIFDYTLTKGTGAGTADYDENTDNGTKSVSFWYTFKFTNSAAYDMAMADGNGKLTVGATLAVGSASRKVELSAAAVAGWANKMKTEPDAGYAFYVTVTGFESLDPSVTGNLEVKLTVSGAAGTAVSDAASYTIG